MQYESAESSSPRRKFQLSPNQVNEVEFDATLTIKLEIEGQTLETVTGTGKFKITCKRE